MYTVKG